MEYQGINGAEANDMVSLLKKLEIYEENKKFGGHSCDVCINDFAKLAVSDLQKILKDSNFTDADSEKLIRALIFQSELLENHPQLDVGGAGVAVPRPRICLGYVVKIYKWPLNIGDAWRSSAENAGRAVGFGKGLELYHVGVVVFNTLFHFNGHGIQQHLEMPAGHVALEGSERDYQITHETRNSFEHWLHNNGQNWTGDKYSFAKNNCICFTRTMCEFLGQKVKEAFDREIAVNSLQTWLESTFASTDTNNDGSETESSCKLFEHFRDVSNKFGDSFKKKKGFVLQISSPNTSRPMENVREAIRTVLDVDNETNEVVVNVKDEMETIVRFTNTGGLYIADLGAQQQ